MSYVITVRRTEQQTALTPLDIVRLLQSEDSLSQGPDGVLVWKDPATGLRFHMNFDSGQLWTDEVSGPASDTFLEKLRSIAVYLDAGVVGEEGEDLTVSGVPARPAWKQVIHGALGGAIFLVALPFLVLMFLVRLPRVMWRITRKTR